MTDQLISPRQALAAAPATTKAAPARVAAARNLPVGYLRAFVTLLVLAHHSVIAYHTAAPAPGAAFTQAPFLWSAFPIVDAQRWAGYTLLVGLNDIYFMALMFFISGLFVWDSLKRKGAGAFVRDRLVRLGIPFAVAATLLSPIAYYPAYLVTGANPGLSAYARTWLSLPVWMSGPAWFIWVLLAFGTLAAGLYKVAPTWGTALGRLTAGADRHAFRFFLGLGAASALAYIGLCLVIGSDRWLSFGPFAVQGSRILHYALYFAVGIGVGAAGLERGLLAKTGALARRWWIYPLVAAPAFVATVVITLMAYAAKGQPFGLWETLGGTGFAFTCAALSMACLGGFTRFVEKRSAIWDSLSANAYGMYLVHYGFAVWLQYALLPTALPAPLKGLIVFAGTVGASWSVTALLRRVPLVRDVL